MIAYIVAGGIIGTLVRYFLQGWVQRTSGLTSFPIGTLVINLVGSLAIGFILRLATGSTIISPDLRAGLTIGFCGAFTTMSTFAYESAGLLGDGSYWRGAGYIGASMFGCIAATIVGTTLANRVL
jgi:CrcB protein